MKLFGTNPKKIDETELNSKEYEKLYKLIIDLEQRCNRLELNEKSFRDKVLRKLQTYYEVPEEEVAVEHRYGTGQSMRR